MSKKQAPAGISWGKASDELKAKVKFVLQSAQNNRYSVSRIYAAYNAIFELQEAPQTCSTCLTSRVKKLREWWKNNAKEDTTNDATPVVIDGVKTTGEKHVPAEGETTEATDYAGVYAKYKFAVGDGLGNAETDSAGELATLGTAMETGAGAYGMSANEFALLEARYGELKGEADEVALNATVSGKLADLGVAEDSSDEDRLEAYKMLADDETLNTTNEQAFYVSQIEVLNRTISEAAKQGDAPADGVQVIDMGEGVLGMHYTPSADDAAKGTILNADGSKVKAGTYTAADGTVIAVAVGGKASIK